MIAQLLTARRAVRHESEVVAALGEPLLAAHPSSAPALRALAGQLAEYWFIGARRVLPLVGVRAGGRAAALLCELAASLAARGLRTLLIDADLRSPRLHARFGVPRGKGLADYLELRGLDTVSLGEHLALVTAGTARDDPLELLSRARLRRLLAAMAARFDALLVGTPAAERGPDFEIFAAVAGGALVFAGEDTPAGELASLRRRLVRCRARVVGTVLERR